MSRHGLSSCRVQQFAFYYDPLSENERTVTKFCLSRGGRRGCSLFDFWILGGISEIGVWSRHVLIYTYSTVYYILGCATIDSLSLNYNEGATGATVADSVSRRNRVGMLTV